MIAEAPRSDNPDQPITADSEYAKCALDIHNYFRVSVGLSALSWDQNLASLAHDTANVFVEEGCKEYHRMDFNKENWVGENLYSFGRFPYLFPDEMDPCQHTKSGVKSFYNEIRNYIYPLGGAPFHKCKAQKKWTSYSHFIQMMSSRVTKIGCSYRSCFKFEPQDRMQKMIVNCYYDEPILMGMSAFSEEVARNLNEWNENKKFGGLKNCTV